ncbi:hypothetical protein F4777DRAFT_544653 [Nemania sp. FL0916]|nr:hypothetical protein F4777DRAFT_544653 [Nemania sp. FL0916]
MMNIGHPPTSINRLKRIQWKEGSLRKLTKSHFRLETQIKLQSEKQYISKILTIPNLQMIGGMRVEWTDNLADHLRLIDDEKTVSIFNCVAFLQFQKNHVAADQQLFPDGFVNETLRTLSLLLPQNNNNAQMWIKKQLREHNCLDPLLAECGSLATHERRFADFDYWHNRLVILKQALDDSQPRTLSQWWFDRRNGVQWYTFWVAILVFIVTIFFGLVQSLEGALQVYLAFKAS